MNAARAHCGCFRQIYQRESEYLSFLPYAILNNCSFRRLSSDLVCIFVDLLYQYRGDFLRRIDDLLELPVTEFVAGKRPVRPIAFNKMTMSQMRKQPMDSEFFVDLSRTVARSMHQKG